jgi:hypothetical protein
MLKKWLAICDNWPHGPTFPGLRDGDKKAEEFVAVVRRMVAEEDVDGSRKSKINHDEQTKRRIQASQLLNRLYLFAIEKVTMKPAQVLQRRS